jgi:hypothetical protein
LSLSCNITAVHRFLSCFYHMKWNSPEGCRIDMGVGGWKTPAIYVHGPALLTRDKTTNLSIY